MRPASRGERRARRVFRILLRFYPPEFRARHGEAMECTFIETWRSAERACPARVRFWVAAVADAILVGLAERVSHDDGPDSSDRPEREETSMTGTGFAGDLRQAVRTLRRSPGFVVLVISTLALGIGANVAILSMVDGVLLRPVPVRDPERLVEVFDALNEQGAPGGLAYVTYEELRRADTGVEEMAAWLDHEAEIRADGVAEVGLVALVSGTYFRLMGIEAVLGRTLGPADVGAWGTGEVAVISRDLWGRSYGADAGVIGATIRIGDTPFTIVGVAPPGFRGLHLTSSPDVWVPVSMGAAVAGDGGLASIPEVLTEPFARFFDVAARLAPGVTPELAAERLSRARRVLPGAEDVAEPITVIPAREAAAPSGRDELKRFLALLSGVVGLTLLAACVNVANLLLVRARRREHDLAVRAALGAGRARLFRQLGVEALVLGLAGGAAAFAMARATTALLRGFTLPGGIAVERATTAPGTGALLAGIALGVVTAVLFGILPAWRASRTDALPGLRARGGANAPAGRRGLLLSAQVALSVVLLVGAALFGRTLQEALRTDVGIRADSAAAVSVRLRPHGLDNATGPTLVHQVVEAARAQQGVSGAAFASHVPIAPRSVALPFTVERDGGRVPGGMPINIVTPGYFELLGLPLIAGRFFTEADRDDAERVIVVNEAAARLLWPDGGALGGEARIVFNREPSRVVGIVGQTLYHDLAERDVPYVYYPLAQQPGPALSAGSFLARSARGYGQALEVLRTALRRVDPTLPTYDARSVARQIHGVTAPQRFGATLLGLFSVLALVIAGVGIYGVAAHTVAASRREIGIRMALGAPAPAVVRRVLGRTALAIAVGAAAGLLGAVALVRSIESFLYGITPFDPVAFAWTFAALAAAALAAAAVPARRASKVDPAQTMRVE